MSSHFVHFVLFQQLKCYSKDGLTCGDPELGTHVAIAIAIKHSMT